MHQINGSWLIPFVWGVVLVEVLPNFLFAFVCVLVFGLSLHCLAWPFPFCFLLHCLLQFLKVTLFSATGIQQSNHGC